MPSWTATAPLTADIIDDEPDDDSGLVEPPLDDHADDPDEDETEETPD